MPDSPSHLPSALERFDRIRSELAAREPFVFLDYDGTLTPIVDRPEDAVLSPGMRHALAGLAGRCRVAVISGREREDVEHLVGLGEIIYAGSHGFDINGPGNLSLEHEGGNEVLPDLDQARKALEEKTADMPGVQVERKRYAVAVHFRRAASGTEQVLLPLIDQVLARHGRLKKASGKKLVELKPDLDWDKGRALLWLLERLGMDRPDVLPIYIGDDLTDEDALRVVRERGIGILAGDHGHPTHAAYALTDVAEVKVFLKRLTKVV